MIQAILIIWGILVLYKDVTVRQIPNALSLGGVLTGVLFLLFTGHSLNHTSATSALLGLLMAFVITMPGYLTRSLGAGDVKLLCAIGVLCGLRVMLESFIIGSLAVGTILITFLIIRPYLMQILGRWLELPKNKFIPYGAALVAGMIFALLLPDSLGLSAWSFLS